MKNYTYSYFVGADLGNVLLGDGNAGVTAYEYATDAVQRYASSIGQKQLHLRGANQWPAAASASSSLVCN